MNMNSNAMATPVRRQQAPARVVRALGAAAMAVVLSAVSPGCAGKHRYDVVASAGPARGAPASVALAPAMLLDGGQIGEAPDGAVFRSRDFTSDQRAGPDISHPTDDQQALLQSFYANLYVGKVWHSGGYELLPEVGNQVRSLGISLSLQQDYTAQVLGWVDENLGQVVSQRALEQGQIWTRLDSSVEAALVPPRRTSVRGTQPLDGKDNLNLPNFTLEPVALDPSALPQGIDADQLLVPLVIHYYAHNGGWFVGQAQGCPAGARFRLLWTLYDVKSGAVVTWGDAASRYVQPYFYQPNQAQLQDYLLAAEALMRAELEHSLLQ